MPTIDRTLMPPELAALPVDTRGYPITFITEVLDGIPDFRITDLARWWTAVSQRLCGMCGQALDQPMAFIGDTNNITMRVFFDPPMHLRCAEYAQTVCPFLAYPNARMSGRGLPEGDFYRGERRPRPPQMCMVKTSGYDVVQTAPGAPYPALVTPWTWIDVTWF